jgi:hypothetical protein
MMQELAGAVKCIWSVALGRFHSLAFAGCRGIMLHVSHSIYGT